MKGLRAGRRSSALQAVCRSGIQRSAPENRTAPSAGACRRTGTERLVGEPHPVRWSVGSFPQTSAQGLSRCTHCMRLCSCVSHTLSLSQDKELLLEGEKKKSLKSCFPSARRPLKICAFSHPALRATIKVSKYWLHGASLNLHESLKGELLMHSTHLLP